MKTDLYLIALNETEFWDKKVIKKLGAKTIHGVYLVDKSKVYRICSPVENYEAKFLFSITNNRLNDKRYDTLCAADASQDEYSYYHCSSIDKLEIVDNVDGITPKTCQYKLEMDFEYETEEEYNSEIESVAENVRGNSYFC